MSTYIALLTNVLKTGVMFTSLMVNEPKFARAYYFDGVTMLALQNFY